MVVLAVLAVVSVMLSALPSVAALVVPLLAWIAWHRLGRGHGSLLRFGADGSLRLLDAEGGAHPCRFHGAAERGPLLVLAITLDGTRRSGASRDQRSGVAGRGLRSFYGSFLDWSDCRRVCFGPDTAPAAQRRLLRLWAARHAGGAAAAQAVGAH